MWWQPYEANPKNLLPFSVPLGYDLPYPLDYGTSYPRGTFFSPLLNKENQQKNEVTPKFLSSYKDTKRT